jgi:hypothetical protein
MDQLDGRLAHLGLVRVTPGHRWDEWITEQLPGVLAAFARWLIALRKVSSDWYHHFVAARPDRLQLTPATLHPTYQ